MKGTQTYRINRYLAASGLGSRRKVESYVLSGRVAKNGQKVRELHEQVSPSDQITLDGRPVALPRHVYVVMNKPPGTVVTRREFPGETTIYRLIPQKWRDLRYAGRLDKNSRGLLILSNDGDLINRIQHPSRRLPKRYLVTVNSLPNEKTLRRRFLEGIEDDGETLRAKSVSVRDPEKRRIEVVLEEGRKRQLRRMFAKLNVRVTDLVREAIGGLDQNKLSLAEGKCVPFDPAILD